MLAAELRQLVRPELADVAAAKGVGAGAGAVEAAEDVHERRLARARGADDGDHLPRLDIEVHVIEHGDGVGARHEAPGEAAERDQRGHVTAS